MFLLILGIAIVLAIHTISVLPGKRADLIARFGKTGYTSAYAIVSLIGFAFIVYGFGAYRASGYIPVWEPPRGMAHLVILLMWAAFVALATALSPDGKIKAMLKYPLFVSVKIWAFAHLLVNGDLGSMILFGSLLAWTVFARIVVKRRGDALPPPAPFGKGDWIALGAGTAAWLLFFTFHNALIGVRVLS